MGSFIEIIKLIGLALIIVLVSKYIIVVYLRKLAETLNLKPRTVGNITGIATSTPEFLTVSFSAATGFVSTGIFNIVISNIVSLLLYGATIIANKNVRFLRNEAIIIDILLAIMAIVIPVFLISIDIEINLGLVPVFIVLYLLFYYIDKNAHKIYLKKQSDKIFEEISKETKFMKGKRKRTIKYSIILVITLIGLLFVGNELSIAIENLCIEFGLPELYLGILLGITTSIPELITFYESQKYHSKDEKTELGVIEATNNLLSSNLTCLFIVQSVGIIIYSMFN